MSSRGGPAARNAINPAALVCFIDEWSEYVTGGWPKRKRLTINGTAVAENDARVIRRWRQGNIAGVTINAARGVLGRHDLTLEMFAVYCEQMDFRATLRGKLPKETTA